MEKYFQFYLAPQKGRLTISGLRTNERPNFRLIFEKDDFITDKNIQALKLSYKEAVKPKQDSDFASGIPSELSINKHQPSTIQKLKNLGKSIKK